MPDNDVLSGPEWDIALTDAFVDRVNAGVRRGQRRRATLAASAVAAGVAAVALAAAAILGPGPSGPPASTIPTTVATAAPTTDERTMAGVVLGYLPAGLVWTQPDSTNDMFLGENDDPPRALPPALRAVRFDVALRRYARGLGWLFVSVYRQIDAPPNAAAATAITAWMLQPYRIIDEFDVPAGRAYLAEGTVYVVLNNGLIVAIEGAPPPSLAELRAIADGLRLA